MKEMMSKLLKQLFTGKDNETQDLVRWLAALSFVVALGLDVYVVAWKNQQYDMQQFGVGLAAIFAAVGAALKLKESTEPGEKQ